ncbi:MAG: DUF1592 domain-containing protein [Verrucomicrobiales bacterium]
MDIFVQAGYGTMFIMRHRWLYTFLAVASLATNSALAETAATTGGDALFKKEIEPLLQKFCFDCHGDGVEKGGLALDTYKTTSDILKDRHTWQLVIKNVQSGEMPPEKKAQPSPDEREKIVGWIESEIFRTNCDDPDPGRVTIRRLNRAEYNNTIRDLVGVDFKPADDFPVDDVGYGFDNIGDVLSLSPVLFEKYLAAAEKIMDQAIVVDGQKMSGPIQRIEAEKLPKPVDGGPYGGDFAMAINKEGEIFTTVEIPTDGDYYIRARAFGTRSGNEYPKLEFRLDDKAVDVKDVAALERTPAIYETRLKLTAGKKKLAAAYINNFRDPNARPDMRDRNLYIDYLEVVGPLALQDYPESHKRIFNTGRTNLVNKYQRAAEVIASFAFRAFRRPPTQVEKDRLVGIFAQTQNDNLNFEEGIKVALTAVLVSPYFLFRGELQPEPNNPRMVHEVNEFSLATRLSYFLWSSMPDEELLRLAKNNELRKNLDAQIARMLKDGRSNQLVKNFAAQWLQIRNLAAFNPSLEDFPEWDEELRQAMARETEMFFEHILKENTSVLDLLNADYTFVNQRLARHYGIPNVKGSEFRQVSLKGTKRGGVLTQGSILAITSNPTRTSPVKRGKWILENILGSPPPPPPPDVPELSEEKEAVLTGSLRQRMEKHRETPICSSCHARMDPIGFGFENFDAIGLYRELDGTFPVDASGKLTSGEEFAGPEELKKILISSKKEEFLRCLSDRMLTFALGRGTEYYDKCAVDRIVENMEKDGYRMQTLISEVIKSVPFQKRRGEGDPLAIN